eukprot:7531950-Pyramimonas_sp.AAC.1
MGRALLLLLLLLLILILILILLILFRSQVDSTCKVPQGNKWIPPVRGGQDLLRSGSACASHPRSCRW